ncbi:MAG: hypothetical protein DRH24_18830, partial [Deltaproteobacteria bacterium]
FPASDNFLIAHDNLLLACLRVNELGTFMLSGGYFLSSEIIYFYCVIIKGYAFIALIYNVVEN